MVEKKNLKNQEKNNSMIVLITIYYYITIDKNKTKLQINKKIDKKLHCLYMCKLIIKNSQILNSEKNK